MAKAKSGAKLVADGPAVVRQDVYRIDDADWLTEASVFGMEFNRPYATTAAEKMGMPQFELAEWDFGTRCDVLKRCHQAWERNPLGHTATSYTRRYAVGTGMKVGYRATEVKELLTEFIEADDNRIDAVEKEACDAIQIDGEIFWWLHEANGKTRLSFIEPWKVKEIICAPNNPNKRIAYELVNNTRIPAEDVRHDAVNRMPYEKRGRPELFRVLPWMKAYRDWLENRARRNRYLALLYDVTLKSATAAQVASKRAQYAEPPSPASIVVHNENETWQVLTGDPGGSGAEADGRRMLLMVAAGLELPEVFFADGSNANLASAEVQANPPMLKFEDYQDIMTTGWKWVFKRVIQNAIDAGLLPVQRNEDGEPECWLAEVDADGDVIMEKADDGSEQPRMVLAKDAFTVGYRKIGAQEPKSLAEALQLQAANEWVDRDTAIEELGRDPYVIRKRLAQQRAEQEQLQKEQSVPQAMAAIEAAEVQGIITSDEANAMRKSLESGESEPDMIVAKLEALGAKQQQEQFMPKAEQPGEEEVPQPEKGAAPGAAAKAKIEKQAKGVQTP